ncbi:MAG: alpha/beta hydrolase [Clostridia bacterium]|nr:alpha/beta hydrolase [Clostridia bacterium]
MLLHGYGSKKESFYYQINFLKNYFRVAAVDFPCFGASEQTEEAWGVKEYADWLLKFMDVSGLNRPHVVAHSFGARVALKLFSVESERLNKLVLTGGAGLVKPRTPQYMRQITRYRRVKRLFPKYAEKHFGSEEYKSLSPLMKQSFKKIVNEDLKDCAAKIIAPTLLIYGNEDSVTPPAEEGETFHSLIAGSTLDIMDGGHFCFSEHPKEFNFKLFTFLTES